MVGPVALAARIALAYRCGGSTGVSPVSRFTRSHETCAVGHRESASIVVRFQFGPNGQALLRRPLPGGGLRSGRSGASWHSHESTLKTRCYFLTLLAFSGLVPAMESDLNALEGRIREAVELCKRLRSENVEMRQRVVQLESENRRLHDKVSDAIERIDTLIGKIPESAP